MLLHAAACLVWSFPAIALFHQHTTVEDSNCLCQYINVYLISLITNVHTNIHTWHPSVSSPGKLKDNCRTVQSINFWPSANEQVPSHAPDRRVPASPNWVSSEKKSVPSSTSHSYTRRWRLIVELIYSVGIIHQLGITTVKTDASQNWQNTEINHVEPPHIRIVLLINDW